MMQENCRKILRSRLYSKIGLTKAGEIYQANLTPNDQINIEKLRKSEWSPRFEELCRNRLILGALRYGKLNAPRKPKYDRVACMIRRLEAYKKTGNDEYLVDVSNLAMLEFEEGIHVNKHFKSIDDGVHTEVLKR